MRRSRLEHLLFLIFNCRRFCNGQRLRVLPETSHHHKRKEFLRAMHCRTRIGSCPHAQRQFTPSSALGAGGLQFESERPDHSVLSRRTCTWPTVVVLSLRIATTHARGASTQEPHARGVPVGTRLTHGQSASSSRSRIERIGRTATSSRTAHSRAL